MRHKDIVAIALQLEEAWNVYQNESDFGSGEDRITMTQEIEQEFFEGECFEMGLTDNEISLVMSQLGF